jgi:hypothetical protein
MHHSHDPFSGGFSVWGRSGADRVRLASATASYRAPAGDGDLSSVADRCVREPPESTQSGHPSGTSAAVRQPGTAITAARRTDPDVRGRRPPPIRFLGSFRRRETCHFAPGNEGSCRREEFILETPMRVRSWRPRRIATSKLARLPCQGPARRSAGLTTHTAHTVGERRAVAALPRRPRGSADR